MTPRRTGSRPGGTPRRGRRDGWDSGTQRAVEAEPATRRPRATGRMAILLLVAVLLVTSFASSLNAYFHQRNNINELRADIDEREQSIDALEKEKDRWSDEVYLQQQARELGYQLPGEKSVVVLDENGEPLDPSVDLDAEPKDVDRVPTAWWETAWGSVELAGHPPRSDK